MPGINGYANVVREGSVASHPAASILDTGEKLKAVEMSGADMLASKINVGEKVDPKAHVVVIPFKTVQERPVHSTANRRNVHGTGELRAGRR